MDGFLTSFAGMLLPLALVLALAWLSLRWLQGRVQRGALGGRDKAAADDDALRHVRGLQLGPRERLVIVEHRGERWMLGVSAGGISSIAHWPSQATVARMATPLAPTAHPQR